jgi:hypothetical protein
MGAAILEALKKSIKLDLSTPECIVKKVTVVCDNTNEMNKVDIEVTLCGRKNGGCCPVMNKVGNKYTIKDDDDGKVTLTGKQVEAIVAAKKKLDTVKKPKKTTTE